MVLVGKNLNMNIAIRADASEKIGTGHVMRCLTLAEELHRQGCRVHFICRAHPGQLGSMITKKGFSLTLLPSPEREKKAEMENEDYEVWLGVSQNEDAEQSTEALVSETLDWLIVDHYSLDARWEKKLRPHVSKIMAIDDLANRKHDCDLFLDQNYFRDPVSRYEGLLPEHCQPLLGPKYALLRHEFHQARKFTRMRGNGIARVLVYFGGNDTGNLTGIVLEAMDCPELRYLLADAVVGPNNPNLEQLKGMALRRPGTRLHTQPEGFAELMLRADICVGAGGTTTWERLCLNLPSLVITVAENQEAFTSELNKAGYINWIGRSQKMNKEIIREALLDMISALHSNYALFPEIVDGKGVNRVADIIMSTLGRKTVK